VRDFIVRFQFASNKSEEVLYMTAEATKDMAAKSLNWDMYRNAAEKKITEYPGASTAFERLTNSGIKKDMLLDGLMTVGFGTHSRQNRSTKNSTAIGRPSAGRLKE